MGFQDRDYIREVPYDDDGYRRRGGTWSVSARIILLNIALFLVNGLFFGEDNALTWFLALRSDSLQHPLWWWQMLTYGFVHSPTDVWHIIFNMIGLVMFAQGTMLGIGPNGFGLVRGENVEDKLGRTEFFWFYILTIIFGGFVYGLIHFHEPSVCLGASGGVCGVVVLYALLYPNKTLLFWGVLPMPMWMIGAIIVGRDALGAAGHGEGGIGYSVHLAGAAFALFYYFAFLKRRRRMTDFFNPPKQKPKLKIYDGEPPKRPTKTVADLEFDKRLDEILDRYGKVGEAGLTKEEREFLKKASQKYKNR